MIDETELQAEWYFETISGQHTNGPRRSSLTLTHIPTGLSVHMPMSKSGHKKKKVAMEMIEWALADDGWAR